MTEHHKIPEEQGGGWYVEVDIKNWEDELRNSGVERPPSDSPYLNKSTISEILGDNSGDEVFNDEEIEEKLANIEKRLTRLLYDIAILSSGGYIDDIDQNWENLENTPDHMNIALRNAHQRDIATNEGDFHFDLGFNTGLALSTLTGTQSEDERGSKFLSGLRKAYSTDQMEKSTREMAKEKFEQERSDKNLINPQRSAQEKILSNKDIAVTEYLRYIIRDYKIGLEKVDGQPSLSLPEATKRFVEDATDDWFNKCCEIRKRLDEEWQSRINASVPGLELDKVLKSLWELERSKEILSISSSDIREDIGYKSSKEKIITQSLNRLSKNGKNPSRGAKTTYKHSEIVYYDHDDDSWELTNYGRLLFYHVFVRKMDPQWIHMASLMRETSKFDIVTILDENIEILAVGVNDYFDD
jgi:hypothetical protein